MFEATRRVLSVLLRKIDGFDAREGILTIGATNRVDDLDRALLSRFDSIIRFPLPGATERAQIFRSYARHLDQASLEELAPLSRGLSGRTIEDICELAERRWARLLIAEKKTGLRASGPHLHGSHSRSPGPGRIRKLIPGSAATRSLPVRRHKRDR